MNNTDINLDNYLITPLFVLLLIGGVIGIITFFFLLRFRKSQGVQYWLVWQIAVSIWAFTYAFEFASTDIETKILWSKLSYLGIVYCTISFLLFSFEFSSQRMVINKRIVIGLYSIATLLLLSPFTNDFHHLHWQSYTINPETNATDYVYGPLFWIIFVFSYLALFIGIVNIVILYFKLAGHYKRQVELLFIASLLPPLGNLVYVFHINPVPGFDWTPFTFLLTGILIAINVSQYQMFDLVPFARNKVIDIIPDAILIVDKSMRIADYNPAMRRLIDLPDREIIGRRVEVIFPHREQLIQEIVNQEDFQANISREYHGEVRYFDLQATSLFDQGSRKNGRLVMLKDITHHILAEEKIKEANQLLTEEIVENEKLIADLDAFSHTVAHDLKNMLGVIVSASGMIQSGIDDLPKADLLEINGLINESATKTMHITRELLTLASVRQQEIEPLPVNMQKVISDSVSSLKGMIDESEAVISLPEFWPRALGYEAWLEEVWINYISNAIKYGGVPPVIVFGHEILADNRAKFWIKDNGRGLTEDQINLLFQKFTRLATLRVEGHGLGLSIVKRIVEKLNGEVGVESNGIAGEGSKFFFILPLAISP
jgi:PAS domain S-box-containing protein